MSPPKRRQYHSVGDAARMRELATVVDCFAPFRCVWTASSWATGIRRSALAPPHNHANRKESWPILRIPGPGGQVSGVNAKSVSGCRRTVMLAGRRTRHNEWLENCTRALVNWAHYSQ